MADTSKAKALLRSERRSKAKIGSADALDILQWAIAAADALAACRTVRARKALTDWEKLWERTPDAPPEG